MPDEAEWLEFKVDNDDPQEIGQQLSALSNAAALHGKDRAFIVWGVQDKTHEIVGTRFLPRKKKIGGQELENWLFTQFKPQVQFWIHEIEIEGKRCVLFEVEPAVYCPVAFKGEEWIRVGSYTKPLRSHPEKERILWRTFEHESFETGIAAAGVGEEDVLELLNYADYLKLTGQPLPEKRLAILERLIEDRLIRRTGTSQYDIANLGAILFANDLQAFEGLRRKTIRTVFYKGVSRVEAQMEHEDRKGYASGFTGLVGYLISRLPQSEEIHKALRIDVPRYPEIAVRELIANALIHQDFDATGSGPMVEIFDDRIEITNPGAPLIDVQRFLDLPPRSRNEKLAHLMRRLKICEERGSGIDKVFTSVEAFQLPAPDFQDLGDHTKAILLAPKKFSHMTKGERARACYQHAGLQWISNRQMTNETLRVRFGFADGNQAMASRIISDTLASGLIKQYDPDNTSRRHARYIPYWA
jgi:predicted HTH transcriptional regulator